MLDKNKIDKLNQELELLNPAEILYWLIRNHPEKVVATSSFQSQSLILLHLISKIIPFCPIIFLNTGYHFPQTLKYVELLQKKMNLRITSVAPNFISKQDHDLYLTNKDMCCYLNKVEPLQVELKKYDVWISGIRRDQTEHRKDTPILSHDDKNDLFKLSPLANMTKDVVEHYIEKFNLPLHPLECEGFKSIGCAPCTSKPVNADERSGRWVDSLKTECGLHLPQIDTHKK